MKEEKFVVLAGDFYYPSRWDDFRGAFSSLEKAIESLTTITDYDWFEIISTRTWEVVREGSAK